MRVRFFFQKNRFNEVVKKRGEADAACFQVGDCWKPWRIEGIRSLGPPTAPRVDWEYRD